MVFMSCYKLDLIVIIIEKLLVFIDVLRVFWENCFYFIGFSIYVNIICYRCDSVIIVL